MNDWLRMTEVARRSGATERQLRRWHGEGLIRGCRPKRGRAPHYCSADGVEAARTLARCRSHVPSIREAKFWLWVEGYERIGIDADTLTELARKVAQEIRGIWGESPGNGDQDALDRQITGPMIEAKESRIAAHAAAGAAAELLGLRGAWRESAEVLAYAPETESGEKRTRMTGVDVDVADNLFDSPMLHALLRSAGVSLPVPEEVRGKAPLGITDVFTAAGLESIESAGPDWEMMRLLWQTFCRIADMPARTKKERMLRDAARQIQRVAYTAHVEHLLLILAAIWQMLGMLAERDELPNDDGGEAAAELERLATVLPKHRELLEAEGLDHLIAYVKRARQTVLRSARHREEARAGDEAVGSA